MPGKNVMQRVKTCGRQAYEVLRESKENVYHSQWHRLEDNVGSRMHWGGNVSLTLKISGARCRAR